MFESKLLGLDRWLSGQEHLLFIQKTWVSLSALTWWFVSIHNSRSRGSDVHFWPLWAPSLHVAQVKTYLKNIHAHKSKQIKNKNSISLKSKGVNYKWINLNLPLSIYSISLAYRLKSCYFPVFVILLSELKNMSNFYLLGLHIMIQFSCLTTSLEIDIFLCSTQFFPVRFLNEEIETSNSVTVSHIRWQNSGNITTKTEKVNF